MKIFMDWTYTGVVVPYRSRVTWQQQCGGGRCLQKEQEGVFFPLGTIDYTTLLYDRVLAYDAELVAEFLKQNDLHHYLRPFLPEELEKWGDDERTLCEAWVPVVIRDSVDNDLMSNHYLSTLCNRPAVLVYPNSD